MNFMDNDGFLEVIFYIVIAVIGIAVNAYRNINKRKEEGQTQAPIPHFPEIEEEHYNDEFEHEEFPEPLQEIFGDLETQEARLENTSESVFIEKSNANRMEEGQAAIQDTSQSILSDDLNEIVDTFSDDLANNEIVAQKEEGTETTERELDTIIDEFDLKKAIIFSEILNPKHF